MWFDLPLKGYHDDGRTAEAWKTTLEKRMLHWNLVAAKNAKIQYHTSSSYFDDESIDAVIKESSVVTAAICCVSAFFGVLIFSRSVTLAGIVVLAVVGVCIGLAALLAMASGWQLSPLDLLSLVVFIGYSVTYSLHIAHLYSHAHDPSLTEIQDNWKVSSKFEALRAAKTLYALRHIGGAVISSGFSTLGAAFFLLFCNFTVLARMGFALCMVTLLSLLFSLVVVPAMLILAGPLPGCYQWQHSVEPTRSTTSVQLRRSVNRQE